MALLRVAEDVGQTGARVDLAGLTRNGGVDGDRYPGYQTHPLGAQRYLSSDDCRKHGLDALDGEGVLAPRVNSIGLTA